MVTNPKIFLTPEEYLTIERKATEKSEYYAGEMFLMSGASRRHNLIAFNITGELQRQLRGKKCEGYAGDMRVHIPATGLYTYPDVVVVCDEPQFLDDEFDTLINPTLIIEVLSPATASYDRGEKFTHYRTIQSLAEYVVFAQDARRAEHHIRQATGSWLLTDINAPQGKIELASIECTLTLSEVYDKVNFKDQNNKNLKREVRN